MPYLFRIFLFSIIPLTGVISLLSCGIVSPESAGYDENFYKGMNIFFMQSRNRYAPDDYQKNLDTIGNTGVNSLFLVPYLFSVNMSDDTVFSTTESISAQEFDSAVVCAQRKGFRIFIKPHVDLLDGTPRTCLSPGNITAWIDAYKKAIDPFISIAAKREVTGFIVGTELDKIAAREEFSSVVDHVRKMFSGLVSYAASYDHFLDINWSLYDMIGVNAWYSLGNRRECTLCSLTESWNHWLCLLNDFAAGQRKKLLLTETGFRSQYSICANPGDWTSGTGISVDQQADAYEALLCQAGSFPRIAGIFFWQWELGGSGGPTDIDYTPKGKPAQIVIRKYWK